MSKLKIALVGCGRIGERHAQHIAHFASLSAVCDIKKEPAQKLSGKYHCPYYLDYDKMLEAEKGADLVSVCTPNGMHADHTIKALRQKKHVLCEKPMAISVRDCERMISEAEKANKRLFIVKQNRFNPPVALLKEIIEKGGLGAISSVQINCYWNRNTDYYRSSDWKGKLSLDGGTLYTQFSHFVDLLYWLFGDLKDIHAIGDNFFHEDLIEFEDTGIVVFRFENNALGSIHYTVNSYRKNMEGSITVFGEKGTVKIGGQYLNKLEYQCVEGMDLKVQEEENRPPNDYGTYQGSMANHDKVYQNVIDVLQNGGSISTNALEGLKTVQIIEKIYSSINQRK